MSEEEPQIILPIIDSHIHLFREIDLPTTNWYTEDVPLHSKSHFLPQFKTATASAPSLLGYVVVEADVNYSLDNGEDGWKRPLEEVAMFRRVALGEPDGDDEKDGLTKEDGKLCLGAIPWAPIPSGADAMEKYIEKVKETAGEAWPKIKGFRFLLQDKEHGTMTQPAFVESLRLLGRKGLVFEVGVDQNRRGKKQLDELLAMIDMVHDGVAEEEKTTFIINHLCKPDLKIYNITSDPSFHAWRTTMYALGKCSNTYMKLSGCFSEMPDSLKTQSASHIFQSTLGWLGIVLATFGSSRIMFGSDWPVCTMGVAGEDAWARWRDVVQKMCWMATLEDEERAMIFGGTAKKAYGL